MMMMMLLLFVMMGWWRVQVLRKGRAFAPTGRHTGAIAGTLRMLSQGKTARMNRRRACTRHRRGPSTRRAFGLVLGVGPARCRRRRTAAP